jgi:DNA-binding NtrC family response regulator
VPPLRDRPAEIPLLAEHFVRLAASEQKVPAPGIGPAALALLRRYAWPGNVRELRNAMERAVVLQTGVIEVEHLPDRVRQALEGGPGGRPVTIGDGIDMRDQIAEVERATIVAALDDCGGNQTRASQKLGLSRRALIYKLEKYGLKPKPIPRR